MVNRIGLIIPTRNRPRYLARILRYYETLRFGHEMIVADSSSSEEVRLNRQMAASCSGSLAVRYEQYDPNLSLGLKLIRALNATDSKYAVICADDDFIVPKALEQCRLFLEAHLDYAIAHGRALSISSQSRANRTMPYSLRTYTYPQRTVDSEDPTERLRSHLADYTLTFYSLHHRPHLIHNIQLAMDQTREPRFAELLPSCLSVIQGKAKCLDGLYLVRQSIGDSTVRKVMSWMDLMKSSSFHDSFRMFRDALAEELACAKGWSQTRSAELVNEAFLAYLDATLRSSAIHKAFFRSKWMVSRSQAIQQFLQVVRILPAAMKAALFEGQAAFLLRSPREAYHWLERRREMAAGQDDMLIDYLLNKHSPYREDFLPIYELVWRYPEGICLSDKTTVQDETAALPAVSLTQEMKR